LTTNLGKAPEEVLAVEARQTVVGANPQEPIPCLQDVIDDIRPESVFRGKRGAAIAARRRLRIEGEAGAGANCEESQGEP
jgi:hypothetical protein